MKRNRLSRQIRKVFPVILATSVLSACIGQEGSTNGGFAGVGSTATAVGVLGGVVLAGALLADDDSSSGDTAVGGTGDVADGTDPGGVVGTGDTDTGGDTGTGAGGDTGTDAGGDTGTGAGGDTGTDAGGDTGTDAGGDTGTGAGGDTGTGAGGDTGTDAGGDTGTGAGGDTGTDAGGDTGTGAGGDTGTDAGGDTGTGAGGDTGTDAGGDTGTDTGTSSSTILEADGSFIGDVFADETLPQSNSIEVGMSDLQFDFSGNIANGCVFVPPGSTPAPTNPGDVSAVTIMIGPPGANGFPGIELEVANADRTKWQVPPTLSAAQMNVLADNLESGNLYLAVRNNEFPNGELRRQILSNDVFKFATMTTSASGGTANGFVLVNEATGDYSITWNTDDPTLVGANFINGFPNGPVVATLAQRASNTSQFFLNGNFNNPGDPIPNIEALLSDGMAGLVAIGADGSQVFEGLLTKMDF